MKRLLLGCLSLCLLSACASQQAEPPSPAERALSLKTAGPAYRVVHAAAAEGPQSHALFVRETGLAGVALGTSQVVVKNRLGAPKKTRSDDAGTWWEYEKPADQGGESVKL